MALMVVQRLCAARRPDIVSCLRRWQCTSTGQAAAIKPIRKLLIANRGEIACRVMRTAKDMGIRTVAVFSDVDRHSMHVAMADEAVHIGKAAASDSYLNQQKLISVCQQTQSDAIHPGYGFLSENAEFADLCARSGINFVGPPSSAIRDMGIKSTSKIIMIKAGVPVIPGYHDSNQDEEHLLEQAKTIGFPIMIKAIRGGGGKGMRIASNSDEFIEQLRSAKRESLKSFGNDDVLLEKYVIRPRHVEVQVFGDYHGNYVHLFERDCSVQRRHQKIIEEAPAPNISAETRQLLGSTAVKAAQAVGYVGAGTVEFVYNEKESKFYFMEMNTRLQVEHPITEMITGTDLVKWQLLVASGAPLPLTQAQLNQPRGHAFEARIYAEDTKAGFLPGAGVLNSFRTAPPEKNVRVETGVREGDEVTVHYDPMIAKLVVWDENRSRALTKLSQQLGQLDIVGLKTNTDFLLSLAANRDFIDANVYTDFIRDHEVELFAKFDQPPSADALLAAAAHGYMHNLSADQFNSDSFRVNSIAIPKQTVHLLHNGQKITVQFRKTTADSYEFTINDKHSGQFSVRRLEGNCIDIELDSKLTRNRVYRHNGQITVFNGESQFEFEQELPGYLRSAGQGAAADGGAGQPTITAPMPGVIEQVAIKVGDSVKVNQVLLTMIAMKMEYVIKAARDGVIAELPYKVGDSVAKGAKLVKFADEQ